MDREVPTTARSLTVLVALAMLVLAACDREEAPGPFARAPAASSSPSPAAPGTRVVAASPTPPALPAWPPPTRGAPSGSCIEGWRTPPAGSADRTDPIGVIRRTAPFRGPFEVVDMRLFVGPESPVSDKGYLQGIRRWYVKLFALNDPGYQGRFLVEERRFGRGVAAVAPYDTSGFRSPDWSGFQWDASDPTPRAVPGLPGRWRGVRYDFVEGGAGLSIPGLPDEVGGCLDGT